MCLCVPDLCLRRLRCALRPGLLARWRSRCALSALGPRQDPAPPLWGLCLLQGALLQGASALTGEVNPSLIPLGTEEGGCFSSDLAREQERRVCSDRLLLKKVFSPGRENTCLGGRVWPLCWWETPPSCPRLAHERGQAGGFHMGRCRERTQGMQGGPGRKTQETLPTAPR